MNTNIYDLRPDFLAIVKKGLEMLDNSRIAYAITCTTRTAEEQADCFKRKVSRCDGYKIKSPHQSGIAIDIVPLDENECPTWNYARYPTAYKRIAAIMRIVGAESGQDWEPIGGKTGLGWDPPHYELRKAHNG
jgi:hypothetical protein